MSRPVKPIPLGGITPKPIARLPTFGWADPKTLSLFFAQKCRVPSHFRSPGYSDLMTIEQHSWALGTEIHSFLLRAKGGVELHPTQELVWTKAAYALGDTYPLLKQFSTEQELWRSQSAAT
jgi:hypothetical protein